MRTDPPWTSCNWRSHYRKTVTFFPGRAPTSCPKLTKYKLRSRNTLTSRTVLSKERTMTKYILVDWISFNRSNRALKLKIWTQEEPFKMQNVGISTRSRDHKHVHRLTLNIGTEVHIGCSCISKTFLSLSWMVMLHDFGKQVFVNELRQNVYVSRRIVKELGCFFFGLLNKCVNWENELSVACFLV